MRSPIPRGEQVGTVGRGPVAVQAAVQPVQGAGIPVGSGRSAGSALGSLPLVGGAVTTLSGTVPALGSKFSPLSPAEQRLLVDVMLDGVRVADVAEFVAPVGYAVTTISLAVPFGRLGVTGVGDTVAGRCCDVTQISKTVAFGDNELPVDLAEMPW